MQRREYTPGVCADAEAKPGEVGSRVDVVCEIRRVEQARSRERREALGAARPVHRLEERSVGECEGVGRPVGGSDEGEPGVGHDPDEGQQVACGHAG